jgi:hypothetical protein
MARPGFDVTVRGVALSTIGLTEWNTFDGLGLLTRGLIWECPNIWYGPYTSTGSTISTNWSLSAAVSTNWSLCAGTTVSTTWTAFSTYNIEDC